MKNVSVHTNADTTQVVRIRNTSGLNRKGSESNNLHNDNSWN